MYLFGIFGSVATAKLTYYFNPVQVLKTTILISIPGIGLMYITDFWIGHVRISHPYLRFFRHTRHLQPYRQRIQRDETFRHDLHLPFSLLPRFQFLGIGHGYRIRQMGMAILFSRTYRFTAYSLSFRQTGRKSHAKKRGYLKINFRIRRYYTLFVAAPIHDQKEGSKQYPITHFEIF